MANIYVRSSDGNNAEDGTTWALAKETLTGAAAIDAAGDNIYVSDDHAENSSSAAISLAFAGTLTAPVKLLSVNDTSDPEPPTALAAGATVSTTGNYSIGINGSVYAYGLTFITSSAGGNNGSASINLSPNGNTIQRFENCTFKILSTSTAPYFNLHGANLAVCSDVKLINCSFRTGRADNQRIIAYGINVHIQGGTFQQESGSYSGTVFQPFGATGEGLSKFLVENFDISGCASTVSLFYPPGAGGNAGAIATIRNSKLPSGWSGSLVSGTWAQAVGMRCEMYNCDSGDTNYRLWIQEYAGSILSETTIVRTGGASDGTTPIAWKMITTSDAKFEGARLASPEIVQWNETTGSSITATVEVITDGVTLTDQEAWIEVDYLGTSGVPLGSVASDIETDILTAAENQTTSSETWTTTGLSSPVKQKLSVTFTPQEKGYLQATVVLAKASTTMYVCPKMDVT
jgi:hypothetical protein